MSVLMFEQINCINKSTSDFKLFFNITYYGVGIAAVVVVVAGVPDQHTYMYMGHFVSLYYVTDGYCMNP